MILRLEHVDDVRTERLRASSPRRNRPDSVLPATVKGRSRLHDGDAVLQQRVDELGRGGEIGLIGRDDVAARIAQLRIVQHGVVEVRGTTAASATTATSPGAASGWSRVGKRSCRAAPPPPRLHVRHPRPRRGREPRLQRLDASSA